jgi:hypothetical protein
VLQVFLAPEVQRFVRVGQGNKSTVNGHAGYPTRDWLGLGKALFTVPASAGASSSLACAGPSSSRSY